MFSGIVAWLVCRKIKDTKYFVRNVTATFILSVLVGSIFLSLFNCARCITPSGNIVMNISMLRSSAEIYQMRNNHSFESLCEDPILRDYKNRIHENLVHNEQRCYGPILRWLVPESDVKDQFICNSTEEAYAAEAYLSDSKKYTCVDSSLTRVYSDESIGSSTSCVLEE